jgi:hypothetical protein
MKGVVMDKSGKSYTVLTEKGDYISKKLNRNYEVGEEINVASTSFDYKSFSAAAAVLILVGILAFNMLLIPYGYAEVAINPSVELGYNRLYNVVKYEGLNEDGVELLKSIKRLKGMQVEDAVDYLVKEADEKGYMSETEENYVVVAYTSKNGEVDKELEIKVNEKIKNVGTEVALMNMEKNHYGEIREKKENPAIEGLKEKLIERNVPVEDLEEVEEVRELARMLKNTEKEKNTNGKPENPGNSENPGPPDGVNPPGHNKDKGNSEDGEEPGSSEQDDNEGKEDEDNQNNEQNPGNQDHGNGNSGGNSSHGGN